MTLEELREFIDGLPDNTEVIVKGADHMLMCEAKVKYTIDGGAEVGALIFTDGDFV
jgi:hypothetical protein